MAQGSPQPKHSRYRSKTPRNPMLQNCCQCGALFFNDLIVGQPHKDIPLFAAQGGCHDAIHEAMVVQYRTTSVHPKQTLRTATQVKLIWRGCTDLVQMGTS